MRYSPLDPVVVERTSPPSAADAFTHSSDGSFRSLCKQRAPHCVPAGSALTTRCETLHGLCKAVGAAPATQGWQLGLPQKCDRRHNRDKCTGLLPDLGIAEKGIHESIWKKASGNRNFKRRQEGRT